MYNMTPLIKNKRFRSEITEQMQTYLACEVHSIFVKISIGINLFLYILLQWIKIMVKQFGENFDWVEGNCFH